MTPSRRWGVHAVGENLGVALQALRANKLRSGLTILGVVIGVATVMTMGTIVSGIRAGILRQFEVAGPTTFYVLKYWGAPRDPNSIPAHIRNRPDLVPADADRIRRLPEVQYAAIWSQVLGRLEFAGIRTPQVTVFGADDGFTEVQGGALVRGRWFTRQELTGGKAVVVVNATRANQLFGRLDPIGQRMTVAGRPAEVIGLYEPPQNIFTPAGSEIGAIVPYVMSDRQFVIDKTQALWIPIKPRDGVSMRDAMDAVALTLREARRQRPGDPSSFELVAQDEILDTFNQLTGAFFAVMIVLASVALLVGGIGVMAMMMVSVTDRTREIGIRKACGATRRDILVQFLVEAAALTGIGGAIGIATGLLAGNGVTRLLDITFDVPPGITGVAVVVSVGIGIVFGVVPARRAARLDPVEAMRAE
jgi:putative ABC transport system permease protein